MNRYQHFINNEWVNPHSGEWFDSLDPFSGEPWAQIPKGDATDVNRAVAAAAAAFEGPWVKLSPSDRGMLLHKFGQLIERDAQRLADAESRDNGKVMSEVAGQVKYVAKYFYYYGGLADKLEGSVLPLDKKGFFAYTRKEPVGVTAIITPWNSPLLLLAWKLAPALAAGCTVVIKPSEFTSVSTLQLVAVLEEAGLPPGVVNVVTGFGAEVGSPLVEHPLVRKISFTGSDTTGRIVNEQAARHLKHVSLELEIGRAHV